MADPDRHVDPETLAWAEGAASKDRCPAGGVVTIGQGFLDPADRWTVDCTECGEVHVVDGEHSRPLALKLVEGHKRYGWKPGMTEDEARAFADRVVTKPSDTTPERWAQIEAAFKDDYRWRMASMIAHGWKRTEDPNGDVHWQHPEGACSFRIDDGVPICVEHECVRGQCPPGESVTDG